MELEPCLRCGSYEANFRSVNGPSHKCLPERTNLIQNIAVSDLMFLGDADSGDRLPLEEREAAAARIVDEVMLHIDRYSGLSPLTPPRCASREHDPPMHLYIPPGSSYTHVCPACGYTVVMAPPYVT